MRYIEVHSYQNYVDFPTFRTICQRFSDRYFIEYFGSGMCRYVGEFEDKYAEQILAKMKSAGEFVTSCDLDENGFPKFDENGHHIEIPYSEVFEKYSKGKCDGKMIEFVNNY